MMDVTRLMLAGRNLLIGSFCLLAGSMVLMLLAVMIDYQLYSVYTRPRPTNYDTACNGLWLGSKWYHGKVSEQDIDNLAKLLREKHIAYGYFHCRDIQRGGGLRYRCLDTASKFIAALHKQCPNTKVIAWVGAVNAAGGGEVNLDNQAVRQKMAGEAGWLVRECGFDGVQWDFEPCGDDRNLLNLLKLTRAQLPAPYSVSVCASRLWSAKYVLQLSEHCDQIALMDYDTACPVPRGYAYLVKQDVINFTNALKNTNCKLMEGVPTYEDITPAHNRQAENLLVALIGVKDGLADPNCNRAAFAGIAPYAEFTTSAEEWDIYNRYWLGK
jgi:hypothetical protein